MGGATQLENPLIAFSSAGQDNYALPADYYVSLPCSAPVTQYQLVAVSYSATTGLYTVAPAAVATAGSTLGVAQAPATTGQLVQVCTFGPTLVLCGVTGAAGVQASAGAGGVIVAASATVGSNIGFTLAATTSGTPAQIWVSRS